MRLVGLPGCHSASGRERVEKSSDDNDDDDDYNVYFNDKDSGGGLPPRATIPGPVVIAPLIGYGLWLFWTSFAQ